MNATIVRVLSILSALVALAATPAGAARHPAAGPPACDRTLVAGSDLAAEIARLPGRPSRMTVCLARGEFPLRTFVAIQRDGVTVRGTGTATVLRLAPGAASPVIVIGDFRRRVPRRAVSHVVLEHLSVVGGGPGGSEYEPEHPYLTNSSIVVRRGRDVVIRDVDVTACRSACIVTEHDTNGLVIEDSHVESSVWDGISLNRTSRARLVGNVIRGNTAAGITVEHLENSVIRENVLTGNKTHGIYLSDSYGNRIEDNRFADNVLAGVFLTCAIRHREPVRCWDHSMSSGNQFARNQFTENRSGFTIAADDAANCAAPGYRPNVSQRDLFARNPNEEPSWELYGRCLRYEAPRSR